MTRDEPAGRGLVARFRAADRTRADGPTGPLTRDLLPWSLGEVPASIAQSNVQLVRR
jgi:hypothetical protein